jgi:hypothetical protein
MRATIKGIIKSITISLLKNSQAIYPDMSTVAEKVNITWATPNGAHPGIILSKFKSPQVSTQKPDKEMRNPIGPQPVDKPRSPFYLRHARSSASLASYQPHQSLSTRTTMVYLQRRQLDHPSVRSEPRSHSSVQRRSPSRRRATKMLRIPAAEKARRITSSRSLVKHTKSLADASIHM